MNWGAIIRNNWDVEYPNYLKSPEWREKREKVMARAEEICEISYCHRDAVDIHHLTYNHVGDEPIEDLQALCRQCHSELHLNRKWNQKVAVKNKFAKCPFRLIDAEKDSDSKVGKAQVILYLKLYRIADWKTGLTPMYTKRRLCQIIKTKPRMLDVGLKILSDEGYIKRLYDDGRTRSDMVKIRFLDDPK